LFFGLAFGFQLVVNSGLVIGWMKANFSLSLLVDVGG
jgi:hypothetical protein